MPVTVTSGDWANNESARFWARLDKDHKCRKYWLAYVERHYRRSLKDKPMPGIWPKFTARSEVAMALHEALEEATKDVPCGFLAELGDASIELVDCYSIAEKLLDDDMVRHVDAEAGSGHRRVAKRSKPP